MAENFRLGIGTPRETRNLRFQVEDFAQRDLPDDDMASARMLGGVLIFAGGFWLGVLTAVAWWIF